MDESFCVEHKRASERKKLLDERWSLFQKGIDKLKRILDGVPEAPFTPAEYMSFYTLIYDICSEKTHAQTMYFRYNSVVADYISSDVMPSLRGLDDELMLRELVKRWDNHQVMVKVLSRFFLYVHEKYVAKKRLPSLEELARRSFRDMVCQQLRDRVKDALIALIDRDRDGVRIEGDLVKRVLQVFDEVGMEDFCGYFEDEMLRDSAVYFSQKASKWIEEGSNVTYFSKVEEHLIQERDRVSCFMHSSKRTMLLEIVWNELIVKYYSRLIQNKHCGLHVPVKAYELAISEVQNLRFEDDDNEDFLTAVFQNYHVCTEFINNCFPGCDLFANSFRKAFHDLLNKKGAAGFCIADRLALYFDSILTQAADGDLSTEVVKENLSKALNFLDCVEDKERFYKVYRNCYSCRMTFGYTHDAHEMFVADMLHPTDIFPNIAEMVSDVKLAVEIESYYEAHAENKPDGIESGVSFRVRPIRSGIVPCQTYAQVIIPNAMVNCVQIFTNAHNRKRKVGELEAANCSGVCRTRSTVGWGSHLLILNPYQAAVLLLFNEKDKLHYKEIKYKLGLKNDSYLRRVLKSLSDTKCEILLRQEPSTDSDSEDDTFQFNCMFTHPDREIRIPMPKKG